MSDTYLARWRGGEYEASPDGTGGGIRIRLYRTDPADGFQELGPGRHRRVVPADEVIRLLYVRDVAEWHSRPVQVLHEQGPGYVVQYTGGVEAEARSAGFDRYDRGLWMAVAPRDELRSRRDEIVVLW